MKKEGTITIYIVDERKDDWNQSVSFSKDLFYDEDDDVISFENYIDFCRSFALAFGWSESLIREAFEY